MKDLLLVILALLPVTISFLLIFLKNNIQLIKKISLITISSSFLLSLVGFIILLSVPLYQLTLVEWKGLGFSLRLDNLSLIMHLMVTIIAFIVLHFSFNYLDGDCNQGVFLIKILKAVAFVQLFIISGNLLVTFLMWVATSVALHKLLLFYPNRAKAQLAAKKKFIVARLGDISLFIALIILYNNVGTGNLEAVFSYIKSVSTTSIPFEIELSAILLVLTAALKSAQLPLHGWLIDVMESPTPVSALLHAGLLNAGPFLMIRFSHVIEASQIAPIVLVTIGATTALFGALVFGTQTAVKTALAYSSVAHMGFTLMVCGMGVYSASLLHLMAHSFYKAHSFLSSGSIIDKVRTVNIKNKHQSKSPVYILVGIVIAGLLYVSLAAVTGFHNDNNFSLMIIGGMILLGIINLFVQGLNSSTDAKLLTKILGGGILVILSFFVFEYSVHWFIETQLPNELVLSPFRKIIAISTLVLFSTVIIMHLLSPITNNEKLYRSINIHLRNGLYLNVLFNEFVYKITPSKKLKKIFK